MEPINERISKIIDELGIKKTEFAERINVSQPFVSQMCSGNKIPSDRTISDICRVFRVNETWLKTGEGEMFARSNRSNEISDFLGDILSGDPDFRSRLISVLARLNTDQWKLIEEMADMLVEETQKEKADR